MVEAIRFLLTTDTGGTPRILVVEDAHWADADTRDIIDRLVATLGAALVLIVVTCRPEFRPDWSRLPHVHQIRLEGLDPGAAGALVEDLLGDAANLAALKRKLSHDAGGIPLYIEEVLRALKESGELEEGTGGSATRNLDGLHIPPSIRGVLSLRTNRLPGAIVPCCRRPRSSGRRCQRRR